GGSGSGGKPRDGLRDGRDGKLFEKGRRRRARAELIGKDSATSHRAEQDVARAQQGVATTSEAGFQHLSSSQHREFPRGCIRFAPRASQHKPCCIHSNSRSRVKGDLYV